MKEKSERERREGGAHKSHNIKLQSCKWQNLFILQFVFPSRDCADLALSALLHLRWPCNSASKNQQGSGRARGAVCCLVRVSGLSQKYHTYYKKTLKLAGLKKHVLLCLFFFFFVALCSSSRMYVSGKVKWNNVQSRDNNGAAPRQQAAPTIFIKTMQTSQEELASYRHIDILNA